MAVVRRQHTKLGRHVTVDYEFDDVTRAFIRFIITNMGPDKRVRIRFTHPVLGAREYQRTVGAIQIGDDTPFIMPVDANGRVVLPAYEFEEMP